MLPTKTVVICPITELKIAGPCTVKTCMWWSTTNSSGCMAHKSMPDPDELTDEDIAEHKGLTVKEVGVLRKRGNRITERVLILYRYLSWVDETFRSHQYPYVQGYNDPELVCAVGQFVEGRWPFTATPLNWNIGKVYFSLSAKMWARYGKLMNTEFDGLRIVGVDPQEAKQLLSTYRAAARKHGASI